MELQDAASSAAEGQEAARADVGEGGLRRGRAAAR